MKLYLRTVLGFSLATSVASLGCVGDIGSGKPGKGTGGTTEPPGVTDPKVNPPDNMPPKDPPVVNVGTCTAETLAKPRAWRLTSSQIKNTLRDTVDFVPPRVDSFPAEDRINLDASRNGFANRSDALKIAPILADHYFVASEELAADVVAKSAKYGIACQMTELGNGGCLKSFVTSFGTKMWRRPLSESEISSFVSLYTTTRRAGC